VTTARRWIVPADARLAEQQHQREPAGARLDGDRLLVPDDPAMVQLMARLGVAWTRERAPFVPLGAGHRHDH
jgi:hypothetical protein